ncbi:MAG: Transposase [Gemmatimonadetes bacterium]|nr:Transposase [Gemmatimonadota bacterium]
MYGWDTLVLLQHLLDEGLSKLAIAQRLGVSRRVVHCWIATGQLTRDLTAATPRRSSPRATQLDSFHPIITARLEAYPELSAVRIYDELRAAGYPGGITQVREYVARVRPQPAPDPVVRYETDPGHQAQVDFAEFRLPWGKRYALVVVLGYSRLLWLKFYPRQTMATVVSGLEEAFAYFGGVPKELLFDQMKAVILDDQRADGGRLLENPEFLRFASHWGFRIRACRPYRAKTKGKVERPIRYVRSNFFYGREFIGDADLDDQRQRWLDLVANVRTHRTTGVVPRVRFETEELRHLQPLAARGYRPLVLPVDRTTRRTAPHLLAPTVPSVVVEQRGLASYQELVEAVTG